MLINVISPTYNEADNSSDKAHEIIKNLSLKKAIQGV